MEVKNDNSSDENTLEACATKFNFTEVNTRIESERVEGKPTTSMRKTQLLYGIDDTLPWYTTLLFGLQVSNLLTFILFQFTCPMTESEIFLQQSPEVYQENIY